MLRAHPLVPNIWAVLPLTRINAMAHALEISLNSTHTLQSSLTNRDIAKSRDLVEALLLK